MCCCCVFGESASTRARRGSREARGHCAGQHLGLTCCSHVTRLIPHPEGRWQESEGQAEAVGSSFVWVAMEKRAWDFSGGKKIKQFKIEGPGQEKAREETQPLADKMGRLGAEHGVGWGVGYLS